VPDGPVAVCDCYVQGAETWESHPWGHELGSVVNIDHHAPGEDWERHVSSGNLAVLYVKELGPCAAVMINHSDCDSVLSSGIVAGILEPKPEYEDAVIAADHTGVDNRIADLLQALQDQRDLALSFQCLRLLEAGRELPPIAHEKLAYRQGQRDMAKRVVSERLEVSGHVARLAIDSKIESELVAPLVRGAWVVAIAFPSDEHPGRTEFKVRLTADAPPGMSLHRLGMKEVDPAFGSRWNAGSNKRAGCTDIPIPVLFERLERKIKDYEAGFSDLLPP
jgi:hypothetical protein